MGQHYPYVPDIILWLTVGYAAAGLTGVGATILRAQGAPRYETYLTGVSAAVNLVATVLLAPHFGIVGVAMGTAAGWCAGTVYFVVTYHRLRPSPWWPMVGSPVARLTFAAVVATALLHLAVGVPVVNALFGNRIAGLAVLAVAGTLYLAVFVGLAWICGAFRFERDDLARRVTMIGGKLSARLGRQAA
jgi:O-antigen/teichoic acid export membrane protein